MAEKKQNLVSVEKDYLDELKGNLKEAEYYSAYYRGRSEAFDYVIETLREILKRKESGQ